LIHDTNSKKKNPAITSDSWHVVHARWAGNRSAEPRFERSIVSEHTDRTAATVAARKLVADLATEMYGRPHEHRDQIFVRQPEYKSLKTAARVDKRRR
jgi:hypothetical protein